MSYDLKILTKPNLGFLIIITSNLHPLLKACSNDKTTTDKVINGIFTQLHLPYNQEQPHSD